MIGGGIAGVTAALALAESGRSVQIAEKERDIGGHGVKLCCKATDVCRQCGACVVADKMARVRTHPAIAILTGAKLSGLCRQASGFEASLARVDHREETVLDVRAVVAATGFTPFDAKRKPQFGYGTCADVVTGLDLEEQIRLTGSIARRSDGRRPKTMAFVQCVGSRDVHIGNDYCSRVCCKYALRMASLLQSRLSGLDVTVFYMDIRMEGKGSQEFYETCRKSMRFVRAIPAKIRQKNSGAVGVEYEDAVQGRLVGELFDMVVLSNGMAPGPDTASLAAILGIGVNGSGFFEHRHVTETNETSVEDIFLAGTCQGPKDIEGSMAHAQAAAARTVLFLAGSQGINAAAAKRNAEKAL